MIALIVLAVVALLLIATSALGARFTRRCAYLEGRTVTLRVWGDLPEPLGSDELRVARIWALGAGVHFRFTRQRDLPSVHIKVAQPHHWTFDEQSVTIGGAKYLQLNGATIKRAAGTPALELRLS